MTEDEIAERLDGEGWMLTQVGDVWHITPQKHTHVAKTLREAEMFAIALDAGWRVRDELSAA